MSRESRLQLINKIQDLRQAPLICYVTGDRENLNTRVAPDILRVFYRHLEAIKFDKRLDLLIYTRGGDVLTPWRLVNLIREYTDYFSVLVPFRAYSAGTLICLGADAIVMGKMGELGPIDPSVANAFNPQDPNNPRAKIPVSVEDVSAYINLVQSTKNNSAEFLTEMLGYLCDRVHPLALGNVHRNYLLIRSIARKLLEMHMSKSQAELIPEIINNLTEKLYAHTYMISRREAEVDLKLHMEIPEPELETTMWHLFEEYEQDLQLLEAFNPVTILKEKQCQLSEFEVPGGVIESNDCLDTFIFSGNVVSTGTGTDNTPNVSVNIDCQGWRRYL